MATQKSGVVRETIDPPMEDRIRSNMARDGARKKTQTKYPVKEGMKDQTKLSGIGPRDPGNGPDASSPNPLDPEPSNKLLRRQPQVLKSSWGMKDADGQGVDNDLAQKVLGDAARMGKAPHVTE